MGSPTQFLRRIIFICLAMLVVTGQCRAHPQDGPHADIKISIDEQSVRFDIVMNLVFMDDLTDVYREDPGRLHEIEEPAARDALMAYFKGQTSLEALSDRGLGRIRGKHSVTVDGVEVTPVLHSFATMNPPRELLALFPVTGSRGLNRVNMVVDYPVKSMPSEVRIRWGSFPADIVAATEAGAPPIAIEAELIAEGLVSIIRFAPDDPEYVWHSTGTTPEERFLAVPPVAEAERPTIPALSLGFLGGALVLGLFALAAPSGRRSKGVIGALVLAIGAGATTGVVRVPNPLAEPSNLPTEAQALAAFQPLHANIYRAFDYAEESDIYDALARSVQGDLLGDLYREVYQSLVMREEGGAVSRVQEVVRVEDQVTEVAQTADGRPSFTVQSRWRVQGVVYHWGHSHTRLNEYAALYTVVGGEEGWRIAESKTLEQFRVDSAPGLADLLPEEL